jgi:hypothetical protein
MAVVRLDLASLGFGGGMTGRRGMTSHKRDADGRHGHSQRDQYGQKNATDSHQRKPHGQHVASRAGARQYSPV